MRTRALGVDGRLLVLRQIHRELIKQLAQLERLRERLRVAEEKSDARVVHMRRTINSITAQTGSSSAVNERP
jgi:hypothetical protein